jgi:hypothetical protein
MTPNSKKLLRFPIDQRERVAQKKSDTLLAVNIYEQLHSFVKDAIPLDGNANSDADLDANRHHSAILIDGARGTGKSAVLVNLGLYLADVDKATFDRVHIFKPVDPTLLEDHDNLFLNVIVAAILSDQAVVTAQTLHPEKRACLHKQLQRLGTALEGLQKQGDQQGLDKLRAFIGKNQLIKEVHNFFQVVRSLLDRQLLIITIDDVDTSLNLAFENLEVVRRYLISPYVLPIISGDQRLYHEVTWREFHGKLLLGNCYAKTQAHTLAQELAREYHRKVLPLQYRLQMPPVSKYLADENICLTSDKDPTMKLPLPIFHAWVKSLLNGPVNGLENSDLPVPLTTVRSLAQLINRVATLIPTLASSIAKSDLDEMGVQRALSMPFSVINALQAFEREYTPLKARNPAAYLKFALVLSTHKIALPAPAENVSAPENEFNRQSSDWFGKLHEHFKFDPMGGAAYLVLQAQNDWYAPSADDGRVFNVFDTPLFQPLRHNQDAFSIFESKVDLSEWQLHLKGRAPESWLARLHTTTILPYPVPELGLAVPSKSKYRFTKAEDDIHLKSNLLLDLMLNKNFYTTNKKAKLVCVGRIVELIITSLVRDISEQDVAALLQRAPFYSFSYIAGTKTQFISDNDGSPETEWLDDTDAELEERYGAILRLVEEIGRWRDDYKIKELRVSPWLIYNVFNKVMNQAWLFNAPMPLGKVNASQDAEKIVKIARKTFYAVWSAFGSFEKGPFFGLPPIVSTVNVGDGEEFKNSDLYRQNIAPFRASLEEDIRNSFGKQIRSITFLLGKHPLRTWVEQSSRPVEMQSESSHPTNQQTSTDDATVVDNATDTSTTNNTKIKKTRSQIAEEIDRAKAALGNELGVKFKSRVEAVTILKALLNKKFSVANATALHARLRKEFPAARRLMATFLRAIDEMAATLSTSTRPA